MLIHLRAPANEELIGAFMGLQGKTKQLTTIKVAENINAASD